MLRMDIHGVWISATELGTDIRAGMETVIHAVHGNSCLVRIPVYNQGFLRRHISTNMNFSRESTLISASASMLEADINAREAYLAGIYTMYGQ